MAGQPTLLASQKARLLCAKTLCAPKSACLILLALGVESERASQTSAPRGVARARECSSEATLSRAVEAICQGLSVNLQPGSLRGCWRSAVPGSENCGVPGGPDLENT